MSEITKALTHTYRQEKRILLTARLILFIAAFGSVPLFLLYLLVVRGGVPGLLAAASSTMAAVTAVIGLVRYGYDVAHE